jgi:hypothetical protein
MIRPILYDFEKQNQLNAAVLKIDWAGIALGIAQLSLLSCLSGCLVSAREGFEIRE